MKLSEFLKNDSYPDRRETKYLDKGGLMLSLEYVAKLPFDPEVISHEYTSWDRTLYVVLDTENKYFKENLLEKYKETARDLSLVMDILEKEGFSRKEAFRLLIHGTFVMFLNKSCWGEGPAV